MTAGPSAGRLARMPTGPELVLVAFVVLGVSVLPSTWAGAVAALAIAIACYGAAGLGDGALGLRALGRQVRATRWILLFTLVSQLVLLGVEPAVSNTARIAAAIAVPGLLMLTTSTTEILDAVERGLRPARRLGLDSERVALLLAVTVSTVPVLARLARDVRDAQRARGGRTGITTSVVPFLVLALKHADDLGDALAARGVR
ncbi:MULTISPECIES: energy-coupling factor transporter transmembrane component T [Clavibacter]|uniref:Cobalt ABC transporter permease n=1 Tax=Clavibacter tessellarius TaxID=31965 RepID=A0A154V0E4_9MICO|nr:MULTISPECIES: energy-coupling factor transporter transmembrane component T [Clavibacter]KZC94841.1 cobalt ABC transporter permease [Clavibacter michiganensis subsp. tessellarius]MDA3805632.1 energy-coupling factor transporter transmembrane component T [Clavibacter sp. CT19]